MAHFKLNDADEHFLQLPGGADLIFAGASGTEAWIERETDTVVRIMIKSVAVASGDGATLGVCIEIGGAFAKGEDGPWPTDAQLRASQSVQVVVKAGQRLVFKAYPTANNAKVVRTVVGAADMTRTAAPKAESDERNER